MENQEMQEMQGKNEDIIIPGEFKDKFALSLLLVIFLAVIKGIFIGSAIGYRLGRSKDD